MKSEPELAKVMAPAPAKYPGSGSKTLDYAGTGTYQLQIYKYSFGKQL